MKYLSNQLNKEIELITKYNNMSITRTEFLKQKLGTGFKRQTSADALLRFCQGCKVKEEDVIKMFLDTINGKEIVFSKMIEDKEAKKILELTLKGLNSTEQLKVLKLNGIETFRQARELGINP